MKRIWILLLVLCLSIAGPAAVGADGMTVFVPLVVRSEPPGSGVVVNGSFEAGRTGWTEYQNPFLDFPLIVRDYDLPASIEPYDGVWAAWLGGDSEWSSWIEQEVTLPGAGPVLVYWHWIDSIFVCDASSYGGVVLDDTWVDAYELCAATDTGGWVKRTVDLSGFAGETVWLRIASVTGVGNYSSLFIDAVSIDG